MRQTASSPEFLNLPDVGRISYEQVQRLEGFSGSHGASRAPLRRTSAMVGGGHDAFAGSGSAIWRPWRRLQSRWRASSDVTRRPPMALQVPSTTVAMPEAGMDFGSLIAAGAMPERVAREALQLPATPSAPSRRERCPGNPFSSSRQEVRLLPMGLAPWEVRNTTETTVQDQGAEWRWPPLPHTVDASTARMAASPLQSAQVSANRHTSEAYLDEVWDLPGVGRVSRRELIRLESVSGGDVARQRASSSAGFDHDRHVVAGFQATHSDGLGGGGRSGGSGQPRQQAADDSERVTPSRGGPTSALRAMPGYLLDISDGNASRLIGSADTPVGDEEALSEISRRENPLPHASPPRPENAPVHAVSERVTEDLRDAFRAERRSGNRSGPRAAKPTKWKVDDAAFQRLFVDAESLPKDHECSICYVAVEEDAVALPCRGEMRCNSIFHGDCIRPWLERNPSCPLCRTEFKNIASPVPPEVSVGNSGATVMLWMSALAEQYEELQAAAMAASVPSAHEDGLNRSRRVFTQVGRQQAAFNGHRHRDALLQGSLNNLRGLVLPASMLIDLAGQQNGIVELRGDIAFGGRLGNGGLAPFHSPPRRQRAPRGVAAQAFRAPSTAPAVTGMATDLGRDLQQSQAIQSVSWRTLRNEFDGSMRANSRMSSSAGTMSRRRNQL
mmetsp:Transcript_73304/g.203327  ORF Transcript_73304/g.203327 Transcript_73304/m.203327 type:complete len:671 (-) Transcript_73304:127-2139(-)